MAEPCVLRRLCSSRRRITLQGARRAWHAVGSLMIGEIEAWLPVIPSRSCCHRTYGISHYEHISANNDIYVDGNQNLRMTCEDIPRSSPLSPLDRAWRKGRKINASLQTCLCSSESFRRYETHHGQHRRSIATNPFSDTRVRSTNQFALRHVRLHAHPPSHYFPFSACARSP